MKQYVSADQDQASAAQAPSVAGATVSHPMQGRIDGSPRQALQHERLAQWQAPARPDHVENGQALTTAIQRAIDRQKLNVVGENHAEYSSLARAAESSKVAAIFGEGSYHTENTFSAMPDIATEGRNDEEKDYLQSFSSKADPPYYAITQGLHFITQWCDEFKSYQTGRRLLGLINSAQDRIETEMISGPLKKLEGSDEERDFVLAHDSMLACLEIADDPEYPQENLAARKKSTGMGIHDELRQSVLRLKGATEAYLAKIRVEYAQARTEFEQFMGIGSDDDLVKKRSVTMAFHTMASALMGHKGVLKVGEYHLVDFATMDLGGATLSSADELQTFLSQNQGNQVLLKSVHAGTHADHAPVQRETGSDGLPSPLKTAVETLSGHAMDDVKVHYDSSRPAQLNALAFAQGSHIHLGPGQTHHLPHEAWHVAQQKQGRVRPSWQTRGGSRINDDPGLEREADGMGQRAVQLARSQGDRRQEISTARAPTQRMANGHGPVQRLSDIPVDDWKQQLDERVDLSSFPAFASIVAAAAPYVLFEAGDAHDNLLEKITELGQSMLANGGDVATVYDAIRRYFPAEYLSMDDVRMVKKYNFDGPIDFTAENAMAWLKLAGGQGTVDDLRYIHHEIYEIKQIQKTEHHDDLVKTEPSEHFEQSYAVGHGAALGVEIRFLMHAVNLIYKKNYQWQHVAASDLERREDFLTALYGGEAVPLNEEGFPDMAAVTERFGQYIDPALSVLLTELKQKRLGGHG